MKRNRFNRLHEDLLFVGCLDIIEVLSVQKRLIDLFGAVLIRLQLIGEVRELFLYSFRQKLRVFLQPKIVGGIVLK